MEDQLGSTFTLHEGEKTAPKSNTEKVITLNTSIQGDGRWVKVTTSQIRDCCHATVDRPIINRYEQLRQKLLETMIELETTKNMKAELLKRLELACQERDQAREQLQNVLKLLVPTNSNGILKNNLPVFPPAMIKANSSFTESNSPSNISSSPVDPVSSLEFANVKNVGVGNHNYNQGFVNKPVENATDFGTVVVDYIARGKVLPQKGKLVEAVEKAGPLLQNLLFAGPLPVWRNPPPPLSTIKIPPPNLKEFDSSAATAAGEINSFGSTWSSAQKPTFLPNSHSAPTWVKQPQMTSRNQQRHQYL